MLSAKKYVSVSVIVGSTGFLSGDNSRLEFYGTEKADRGVDEYAYTRSMPDGVCHKTLVKEDARGRKYIALGGYHIYLSEFVWG